VEVAVPDGACSMDGCIFLLCNLGDDGLESPDEGLDPAPAGLAELGGRLLDDVVVQPQAPLPLQRLLVPQRQSRHDEPGPTLACEGS
jgi:hypothetical protein